MAAYISVPRDFSKVKSKVAFNLTARQLICFGAAAVVGVPLFFVLRDTAGNSGARSRERRLWLRYYTAKQRGNPPALPKVERCTGKEHGRKAVSCLKTIGHD